MSADIASNSPNTLNRLYNRRVSTCSGVEDDGATQCLVVKLITHWKADNLCLFRVHPDSP